MWWLEEEGGWWLEDDGVAWPEELRLRSELMVMESFWVPDMETESACIFCNGGWGREIEFGEVYTYTMRVKYHPPNQ